MSLSLNVSVRIVAHDPRVAQNCRDEASRIAQAVTTTYSTG